MIQRRWLIPILALTFLTPVLVLAAAPEPATPEPATVDPVPQALASALDDEWRSAALYQAVLDQLGDVRPFAPIVQAEHRHAGHLLALYDQLGLEVPANRWLDHSFEIPKTLAAACEMAVTSEVDNVALYDRLLADLPASGTRDLLEHLQWVSREHHKPAFERCAGLGDTATAAPPGRGHGRRGGGGCCGGGGGGCCGGGGGCGGGHGMMNRQGGGPPADRPADFCPRFPSAPQR